MKIGVYNAILHDLSLDEALDEVVKLGLDGVEVNSGGFLPPNHLPIDEILSSDAAAKDYLKRYEDRGLEILGLNCNGNPLNPDPAIGPDDADDIRRSIRAAAALGQKRVVTMSGLPGSDPDAHYPAWNINAWGSRALDSLEWQWDRASEFWTEIDELARQNDVKVALELHPQNLVFNPATARRLVDRIGATNIGVELDASHLFWQQMDPVACVRWLGPLVYHAAAKDVRINRENAEIHGVLDERFRRLGPEEPRTHMGGDEYANEWPQDSAWDFVTVGIGHDADYWAEFLRALAETEEATGEEMCVNIEHEDTSMGAIEGLELASRTLFDAAQRAGLR
ncbi:sugar phosphate isomerase/epimerase [Rothia sp. HC945]|uniref:sugar phosphate isomerase/epimerase family protein n=1 Tax=Rothia sp. HC945 TaxID=3171170 RepID=UPI002655AF53|nr:sugar phosphate isomerase/epimerase [Kocuria sp.]